MNIVVFQVINLHLSIPLILLTIFLCSIFFFILPPDAIVLSHFPHGPTIYFTLHNTVLRHDTPDFDSSTISEQYPHLIFENLSSPLGQRVKSALRYCFPVPREESKRVLSFVNDGDFISFRFVRQLSLFLFIFSCLTYSF